MLLVLFFACSIHAFAQTVVSGPLLGHTELRTSNVWIQLKENVSPTAVILKYVVDGVNYSVPADKDNNKYVNIYRFEAVNLQPGKTYNYTIEANKKQIASGSFTTQQLWQWRTQVPEFSFITGSCAYVNQPEYDRVFTDAHRYTKKSTPYGGDSSIFESMAKEKADFMLWLGDNWYTREVDYYSKWGLTDRVARERAHKMYQDFWKAMPHYAIWDDHDYGPNDSDKSYVLKKESRNTFMSFWNNPSYGMNGEGIYTKFTWNDVDVFMLDDRWFRANDNMEDSINGLPNPDKRMFGKEQMEWLKNALLQSKSNVNINFRIIATGSQMLNPVSPYDCFRYFPAEYQELMQFLEDNKIRGILFLTGDRHHSEIIKKERPNTYPLYDITASPLTSGTHSFGGPEKDNPFRVLGIDKKQNYAKFNFSGLGTDRLLTVTFHDVKGEKLGEWSIKAKDLR